LDKVINVTAANVMPKADRRTIISNELPIYLNLHRILLAPRTSLKTNTPHKEATTPGPVVIIGKAVFNPNFALATNQQMSASDHSAPLRIPGNTI
jgi:hypothetical protein